jgi:chromosomal replication initiator protein
MPSGSRYQGDGAALRLPEFVAGPENSLAATALAPFLRQSPSGFNPLVIYGPHGSGKTHLAHGLADWWQRLDPAARVEYLTGSEFAQQVGEALAAGTLDAWRAGIRSARLFILEDLGELAGKQTAQVELLHALDALVDAEAAIVVTARSFPGQQSSLLPALRGRLSVGLAVPLVFPSRGTRRAILERLVAERGTALSKRAMEGLASSSSGSVPSLVAALLKLELAADGAIESHAGQRAAGRETAAEPSLRDIATLTAKYFGLRLSELKSPARRRTLVAGRGVAMFLARQLTSRSLGEIGEFFGGRDHTTVLYGCRRTEKLLRRDRATRHAVGELRKLLSARH